MEINLLWQGNTATTGLGAETRQADCRHRFGSFYCRCTLSLRLPLVPKEGTARTSLGKLTAAALGGRDVPLGQSVSLSLHLHQAAHPL